MEEVITIAVTVATFPLDNLGTIADASAAAGAAFVICKLRYRLLLRRVGGCWCWLVNCQQQLVVAIDRRRKYRRIR